MTSKVDYSGAFVALHRIAAVLKEYDKSVEADALKAVMCNDMAALEKTSLSGEDLLSLHNEIQTAMDEEKAPSAVRAAVTDIFKAPLKAMGVKMSNKKIVSSRVVKVAAKAPVSTYLRLESDRAARPKEITRPLLLRKNLKIDTSGYSNMDQIGSKEVPTMVADAYEKAEDCYAANPNSNVNKGRFKDTQEAHDKSGVLIVPSYMNYGVMFRDDVSHMIMEQVANRGTTGLSAYVGGVPLNNNDLNTIGDVAVRLVLKNEIKLAKRAAAVIYTELLRRAADAPDGLQKAAYDNTSMAWRWPMVSREVVYPIRPVSNALQYAHPDQAVSIDPRSLFGIVMRIDVKNKVMQNAALSRPVGKTADDLKVQYLKMLNAGEFSEALKFRKSAAEIYDVNCGEYDDKIIERAHKEPYVKIEDGIFPTETKQQDIDEAASKTVPTGKVSDEPKHFAFINLNDLTDKFLSAKKKDKGEKAEKSDKIEPVDLSFVVPGAEETEYPFSRDIETKDMEDILGGPEVVEVGDEVESPLGEQIQNTGINFSIDPDTGVVTLNVNMSADKKFDSAADAMDWAVKLSELLNTKMADIKEAGYKLPAVIKAAQVHNEFVKFLASSVIFSRNINTLLDMVSEFDQTK